MPDLRPMSVAGGASDSEPAVAEFSGSETSLISVSIIIPCFNGGRFLADTLKSAVEQTRSPLEVIVVDDGSTDDSAAIAEGFGAPVRVIRQANQGESVARNRGITEARGTHLLFLDADDMLAPESLARLIQALDNRPDAVAVMGSACFGSDPRSPDTVKEARHHAFYPEIIEQNIAPPHCWLTPRYLVLAAGGFCESMRWFEDWDLWWRVGLHARALIPVSYVGALYRQHATSQLATTHPANRARGHATLVSRMAADLLERPSLMAAHGYELYRSLWSALTHAREKGVSWNELRPLSAALLKVARRGPAAVRSLRSARALRLLGVRAGFALLRRPASIRRSVRTTCR